MFHQMRKKALNSVRDGSSPVVKDLRIVLLGKTGAGKSDSGNTLLGWDAFKAENSPSSVTKTCKRQTAKLNERSVSVIDTPGILDTSTEIDELKREIEKCIEMSVPGPHMFLLVIRLDTRYTEEEKKAVQWISENFGEEAAKYTMVLFTRGDTLRNKSMKDYVAQSPELTELVGQCTAGYAVFDNTCRDNRTQVSDLLEKIDKMAETNGTYYTSDVYKEAQRRLENKIWWSNRADNLITASNLVLGAAAVAAGPAVGPAVGAAVAAEEVAAAAAATLPSVVMFAGAGALKLISGWIKRKPENN